MKSLIFKLTLIFLVLALVPLVIGVNAFLSLQTAEKAVRGNDEALGILSGLIAKTSETIGENVQIQASANNAAGEMASSQGETSQALRDMRDSVLPRTLAISRIRFALSDATSAERALLLALNMRHIEMNELDGIRQSQLKNIDQAMATIANSAKEYAALMEGGEERKIWSEFDTALGSWQTSHREFLTELDNLDRLVEDLIRGGPLFAAASRRVYDSIFVRGREARRECERLIDLLAGNLGQITDTRVRQALDAQQRARQQLGDLARDTEAARSRAASLGMQITEATDAANLAAMAAGEVAKATRRFRYLIVFSILGVVVALLIGVAVSVRLSRPLRETTDRLAMLTRGEMGGEVPAADLRRADEIGELARSVQDLIESTRMEIGMANAIAEGDYTQNIEMRSDDDKLGLALNIMVENTNSAMHKLGKSVQRLHIGAQSVSEASRSLSQGAETSAQALEEITETVADVDKQAQENATSAQQAKELAVASRGAAQRGYNAVSELVSAMEEIRQSGSKIASVAKLIDGIAFQTNLLALNAAVEAARAGRHGRGFSVVADEVRSLSGRSAKAAQETSAMVEAMTARMENGADLAERSDGEFREIVEATGRVVTIFEEITEASNSQSEAVAQISLGLSQIDMVIQDNTRNASWTADAAHALSRQADELRDLVSRFRISRDGEESREPGNTTRRLSRRGAPALPQPGTDERNVDDLV